MKHLLAVMTDLFFAAKIGDIAKKHGMTAEFTGDYESALRKIKARPAVVIFDLNSKSANPAGLIEALKSDPETNQIQAIGFVSHVQTEVRRQAEESGCDFVFARSVFAQKLDEILSRYATSETSSHS
jgi:CheY-like chemotaxis protein